MTALPFAPDIYILDRGGDEKENKTELLALSSHAAAILDKNEISIYFRETKTKLGVRGKLSSIFRKKYEEDVIFASNDNIIVVCPSTAETLSILKLELGCCKKGHIDRNEVETVAIVKEYSIQIPINLLPIPRQLYPSRAVNKIACGSAHALILLDGPEPQLYSWGAGSRGELGIGFATNFSNELVPVKFSERPSKVLSISAGFQVSLVAVPDTVFVFGAISDYRPIGIHMEEDNKHDILSPESIEAFEAINQTCQLNAEIFCGDENNENLDGIGVIKVSCGLWHFLALCRNGDLYGWGWNSFGQLGISANETDSLIQNPRILNDAFDFLFTNCNPDCNSGEEEKIIDIRCGSRFSFMKTNHSNFILLGYLENTFEKLENICNNNSNFEERNVFTIDLAQLFDDETSMAPRKKFRSSYENSIQESIVFKEEVVLSNYLGDRSGNTHKFCEFSIRPELCLDVFFINSKGGGISKDRKTVYFFRNKLIDSEYIFDWSENCGSSSIGFIMNYKKCI